MNNKFFSVPQIFLLASVLSISFCSLSACAQLPMPGINNVKAVELAINACKRPHLVLVGEPTNIRSQFVSLAEADKMTKVEGETNNYMLALDAKVWLVRMDGQLQLVGGPEPVMTPNSPKVTPTAFMGTCTAVLDASSGALIFVRDER